MEEDKIDNGMDISVRMALISHLSDAMHDDSEELKNRINFIKSVVMKYVPKDIETTTDELDDMWSQVSGSENEKYKDNWVSQMGKDAMDQLDDLTIYKEKSDNESMKNLNEEVSKIKKMMGLNEIEMGDDEINWDDTNEIYVKVYGTKEGEIGTPYGRAWETKNYYGFISQRDLERLGNNPIRDIDVEGITEFDDEPSDDQIYNSGNYEGGISHGGSNWQGR